jgi:hypothetical protein
VALNNLASTLLHGIKDNTRSSYSTGFQDFKDWCTRYGWSPWSPSAIKLALWVDYKGRFISVDTIRGYLAGIARFHVERGLADPAADSKLVEKTLHALALKFPHPPPAQKFALTLPILRSILHLFDFRLHNDRVLWACTCIAVYLALRGGSFLWKGSGPSPIRWEHFRRVNSAYHMFTITHSTKQRWKLGFTRPTFANGSPTCPIAAFDTYSAGLGVNRKLAGLSLFQWDDGSPVCRIGWLRRLGAILSFAGYDGSSLGIISCRRGCALSLAFANGSDTRTMFAGRWKTNCFRRYIPDELRSAALKMSKLVFVGDMVIASD